MPKYAFDTNVYVDALRKGAALQALSGFLRSNTPAIHLSAVVLHEVLAGAKSTQHAEALEEHLAAPFFRTGRVFAPTTAAWRRSGTIVASLRKKTGRTPNAALVNDVLLALSCRELGITLVTRDRDFAVLGPLVPGLSVVEPFPQASA